MLTESQVNQFKLEGYCIYTGLLSEIEVTQMLKQMEAITTGATLAKHDADRLEMEPNQGPDGTKVRRIYEPCTYYNQYKQFSESTKLLGCVEQLIGPNLHYVYSKINVKPSEIGSVVEWHQDAAYGPVTNRSDIAILIYLDDAELGNGCLQVIPGQRGMLDHSRDGIFQGRITEPLDISKALPIEAKQGTGIFFNGHIPHASSPNLSSKPRRTLIIGYRSADAFPIYAGEMTRKGQQYVRLVRGKESNVARLESGSIYIPRYPAQTKSLYELQDLARRQEAAAQQ